MLSLTPGHAGSVVLIHRSLVCRFVPTRGDPLGPAQVDCMHSGCWPLAAAWADGQPGTMTSRRDHARLRLCK